MSWPSGAVNLTNVDAAADDPSLARADIKTSFDKINLMIPSRGAADGVASLNASAQVPAAELALALLLTGGTLTNFLTLHAAPTVDLHASTKKYVDDSVAASTPFPAGTKMLFRNTTAPTGWTKDTSFNEHALRVVTGSVGSGGADNFSTVFGTGKVVGSTTLTAAQSGVPAHTHPTDSQGAHTHSTNISNNGGGALARSDVSANDGFTPITTSSDGAHTHTANANTAASASSSHNHILSNLNMKYADVIIATKD